MTPWAPRGALHSRHQNEKVYCTSSFRSRTFAPAPSALHSFRVAIRIKHTKFSHLVRILLRGYRLVHSSHAFPPEGHVSFTSPSSWLWFSALLSSFEMCWTGASRCAALPRVFCSRWQLERIENPIFCCSLVRLFTWYSSQVFEI